MENEDQGTADSRMVASPDDPRISVHCLSEFAFCPRAGLCLYEQDEGDDDRHVGPSTDYLPIYDRRELQRTLKCLLRQFWSIALAGVVMAGGGVLLTWLTSLPIIGVLAAGITVLVVLAMIDRGYWAFVTIQYLSIWEAAQGRLPDAEATEPQEVHWCDLLTADFVPASPPAPYRDDSWKIGGRPWRVLRYGNLRIPVFLHRTEWKGLYRQHFVRMSAYCHLLEECEGFRSPYGIVLRAGTFAAVSVPNTPTSRKAFHDELVEAREAIRGAEVEESVPPIPCDTCRCEKCHVGKPYVYRCGSEYLRHSEPIAPFPAETGDDRDDRVYHSHCGDRFGWLPPHEKAREKGLLRRYWASHGRTGTCD